MPCCAILIGSAASCCIRATWPGRTQHQYLEDVAWDFACDHNLFDAMSTNHALVAYGRRCRSSAQQGTSFRLFNIFHVHAWAKRRVGGEYERGARVRAQDRCACARDRGGLDPSSSSVSGSDAPRNNCERTHDLIQMHTIARPNPAAANSRN
jgi:hypothetical protein